MMTGHFLFILFFGTRPGRRREGALPGVPSPYCGQTGQLQAVVIPRYVHLFWIPVYRLRSLAFAECGHCKKVYEGAELTPGMQQAMEALSRD